MKTFLTTADRKEYGAAAAYMSGMSCEMMMLIGYYQKTRSVIDRPVSQNPAMRREFFENIETSLIKGTEFIGTPIGNLSSIYSEVLKSKRTNGLYHAKSWENIREVSELIINKDASIHPKDSRIVESLDFLHEFIDDVNAIRTCLLY